jgi:hypothetical protein
VVDLGITAPATAPTAADSGAAGNPDGVYSYKVTFVNDDGYESNPSPASGDVTVATNKINLTDLPISTDPQVVARNIYRTAAGGSTYKYVAQVANAWTDDEDANNPPNAYGYQDDTADASLGADVETDHDTPPALKVVHSHVGLLYGVENARRNVIWYCNEFDAWEYFDANNYYYFGSTGDTTHALHTLGEFLLPVQEFRIWKLDTSEATPVKSESFSDKGVFGEKAAFKIGDALIVAENSGVFLFDTVRAIEITQLIADVFDVKSSNSNRVDSDWASNMVVCYLDGRIYLSYTKEGSVENDMTLVYDIDRKIPEALWDVGFSAMTVDKQGKSVYAHLVSDGKVYEINTGDDDNGTDISWIARTKDFAQEFGGATVKKRADFVKVDCNPNGNDLVVDIYVDGSSVDTRTLTGSSRSVHRWRLPVDRDWYRISFRLTGTGQQEVHAIGLEGEPREY